MNVLIMKLKLPLQPLPLPAAALMLAITETILPQVTTQLIMPAVINQKQEQIIKQVHLLRATGIIQKRKLFKDPLVYKTIICLYSLANKEKSLLKVC